MTSDATTAVIGAGPYGLAATAHLRGAGHPVHLVGRAMSFWEEQMPAGMLLRSPYAASSIGSPGERLSLDAFAAEVGEPVPSPVPLDRFVEYGRWFQAQVAPDLDERTVHEVARDGSRFRVVFEDGDELRPERVVLATGIARFAHVPDVFRSLPPELVSHAADHRDLGVFAGREVLVVGRGQSALESAALLHEAGARVQVVTRSPDIRWLGQRPWLRQLGPVSSLIYSPAEVGPPVLCRLVDAPGAVRVLPAAARCRLYDRSVRPAGAAWLRDRILGSVPLHLGRRIVGAVEKDGRPVLELDDGGRLEADHVLLGTGYRVDLARGGLLSSELLGAVRRVDGHPVLQRGHETSVDGLHVMGAPATWSYGPIMRFVAGTQKAAADLTRAVVGRRSP